MISIFFKKADRYHLFFLSLSLSALLFGLAFFLFVFFVVFFPQSGAGARVVERSAEMATTKKNNTKKKNKTKNNHVSIKQKQ